MTLATDGIYGRDLRIVFLATGPDLDPAMTEVTGIQLLAQSLVCRQMIVHGSIVGFPNDGIDVRAYLGKGIRPGGAQQIGQEVAAELQRDKRVFSATVVATFDQGGKTLRLVETINCALGPFTMTLVVSAVSVQLLQQEAA